MIKLSLIVMLVLTFLISTALRWRDERRPPTATPRKRPRGFVGMLKARTDRWVTAAALAAVTTMIVVGGLNWLRIWQGG